MDRDKRWDRVKLAYDAIAEAKAPFHADDALVGARAPPMRAARTTSSCKPTVIDGGARDRTTATRSCS